jgi:cell division protein FtsQ
MDNRGRELQQVGTGSRFWWRVLDAHTPQTAASNSPPRPVLRPFHSRPAVPAPSQSFTLHVPRGDRRRSKRKASKASNLAIVFAGLMAITGSGTVVALTLSDVSVQQVRDNIRHYTTVALISAGFGIDQVSLTGQRYTIDSHVFDALDLTNVKTFSALDTAAALKRIERISWVESAQMTRVFPGMLNVEIRERTPSAIWQRGDNSYLIDATGRTLGPLPPANEWKLPTVVGEGANEDAAMLLAALSRHSDVQAHYHYAERIAERRWSVVLNNGSRIELGADREVEGLDHVAANRTLRKALNGATVIVDVRTAGRAVIRPLVTPAALRAPLTASSGVQQQ